MAVEHKRQKEFYDRRVHGQPYVDGDLVWLHSPVVPRGKFKKFHHPWTGPYKVIKQLSDVNYRIQSVPGRRRMVVHFDRLKPCHPATRLDNTDNEQSPGETRQPEVLTPPPIGTDLEVFDDDQKHPPLPTSPPAPPRRYPTRMRHAPDRYGTYIEH